MINSGAWTKNTERPSEGVIQHNSPSDRRGWEGNDIEASQDNFNERFLRWMSREIRVSTHGVTEEHTLGYLKLLLAQSRS